MPCIDRPSAAYRQSRAGASQRTSAPPLKMHVLRVYVVPVLALSGLMLSACEGPNEEAGKARDKATAAARGSSYRGEGPAERIGKAQDRAVEAASDARDAEAKSLRRQADAVKAGADVEADRLEQQARSVREEAKRRVAPLEAEAKDVRER